MTGEPVEINPSVGHGFKIMTVDEWTSRWKVRKYLRRIQLYVYVSVCLRQWAIKNRGTNRTARVHTNLQAHTVVTPFTCITYTRGG